MAPRFFFFCCIAVVLNAGCTKDAPEPINPPPTSTTGTVTDLEGNVYSTVKIGSQWWMSENLNASVFQNGQPILNAIPFLGAGEPAWCYYDHNGIHAERGKLYNFYAAADSRNICPEGWHIPTDAEWQTLVDATGGEIDAGGALKGDLFWEPVFSGNSNSSGFNAYPGGYLGQNNTFYNLGTFCGYWSSTSFDSANAWNRYMPGTGYAVFRSYQFKGYGYSCRCVK